VMCDEETLFVAKPIAEAVGFKFWKSLIWLKPSVGLGYHWRNKTERVMFLEKGKRKLNNLGLGDVIEAPRVRGGYPTEKPIELSTALIANSTQPGELVIDPFVGSGSVGVAARTLGRRFAGCDVSPLAIETTTKRMAALDPQE
jgi:site-specific DNA-methyltransferase (adenine-specific)